MPEHQGDKTIYTLQEVTGSIQKTLAGRYGSAFWMKAEMNKLNHYRHSGHCYPELVEKKDGKTVAQIRSHLWHADYLRINHKFVSLLKEPLKDGIKVLLLGKIVFDPVHGLSVWIQDIDPGFTLGDLEREKAESILRLQKEGIFNRNRQLSLPLLPKRIAIVSVETSKGYADFMQVLNTNPWGYGFFCMLFPSILQGDHAADNIIAQLKRIEKAARHFDAVVIIRGGGGDVGLSCYNSYELARTICLFPLPVMTGIGHATNETVTEMVAHVNAITPTKLAEHFIQLFHQFAQPLEEAVFMLKNKPLQMLQSYEQGFAIRVEQFKKMTRNRLAVAHSELGYQAVFIGTGHKHLLNDQKRELNYLQGQIQKTCRNMMNNQKNSLDSMNRQVMASDPDRVLQKGYSITYHKGQILRDSSVIRKGDAITTYLHKGTIKSTVNETERKRKNEIQP